MTIKLWGRPTSARTQKVLLALAELGRDYDLTLASATMGAGGHVSKGGQPHGVVDTLDYRAMNPNGTVPTIDDNGFVLWESNAIVQYLAMTYDAARMYGGDAKIFASASRWMLWENNELIPPMHAYAEHTIRLPQAQRDPAVVEASREKLARAWRIVDDQLARTRHIAHDDWTMGDIPMTIRVHRWELMAPEGPHFDNIRRYYDQVRERPSFRAIADPEMHITG